MRNKYKNAFSERSRLSDFEYLATFFAWLKFDNFADMHKYLSSHFDEDEDLHFIVNDMLDDETIAPDLVSFATARGMVTKSPHRTTIIDTIYRYADNFNVRSNAYGSEYGSVGEKIGELQFNVILLHKILNDTIDYGKFRKNFGVNPQSLFEEDLLDYLNEKQAFANGLGLPGIYILIAKHALLCAADDHLQRLFDRLNVEGDLELWKLSCAMSAGLGFLSAVGRVPTKPFMKRGDWKKLLDELVQKEQLPF